MSWDETRAKRPQFWTNLDCRAALERVAEQDKLLDSLKTEAGRTAFALSVGWPLPEEVAVLRQRVEKLERDYQEFWRANIENPSPGGPALTGGTPDGVTGVSPESPVCFHCGYRRENVLAPEARASADVAIKEHDRMAAMLRDAEAKLARLRHYSVGKTCENVNADGSLRAMVERCRCDKMWPCIYLAKGEI